MGYELTFNDMQYINDELIDLDIDDRPIEKFKKLIMFYNNYNDKETKDKINCRIEDMFINVNNYCFNIEPSFKALMSKHISDFYEYCDIEVIYCHVKAIFKEGENPKNIYCLGINGALPYVRKYWIDHMDYELLMNDFYDNDTLKTRPCVKSYSKLIEYEIIERFSINILALLILTKSHLVDSNLYFPQSTPFPHMCQTPEIVPKCEYFVTNYYLFGDFQLSINSNAENDEIAHTCIDSLTKHVKYMKSLTKDYYHTFIENEFIEAVPYIRNHYENIGDVEQVNDIYITLQQRPYRV